MARLFTSDLHFGHSNIIKYAGRPYRDASHMNTAIINALTEQVDPDDELFILGDIAMGRISENLPLLERIPCRIVIVAGNHDRCHPANGEKHTGWISQYSGLRNVQELHLGNLTLTLPDETVVNVSHFPYAGKTWEEMNSHDGDDRYGQWRPENDGKWLLCGHVHDAWRVNGRQINIGWDAWAGRVVTEQDLMTVIGEGPGDADPLPWVES